MTRKPYAFFLSLALAGLLSVPVAAQTPTIREIPPDLPGNADLYFWCASALSFMGAALEDPAEAESFYAASESLFQRASATLMAAEIPAGDVRGIVGLYDERVVAEFESGDMTYESQACITALDEE